MASEIPQLVVANVGAWRKWLAENYADPTGVWLVLAKKGTTKPTSLTYDEALDEALRYGWIDGQTRRADEATYSRRFTPRRARSVWSKRNVGIVERLIAEDRMHAAGLAEVERAQADGRWDAAYAGSKAIEIPPDFAVALRANRKAKATFEKLDSQNRFAFLYRIGAAKRADTRARKIDQFVEMLARGETIHPPRGKS